MARQQSRATIEAEIASLQKKLLAHDKAQAERIGKLALKAGLASLEIPEATLLEEFEGIARRFRGERAPSGEEAPEGDGVSRPGDGSSQFEGDREAPSGSKPSRGSTKSHAVEE